MIADPYLATNDIEERKRLVIQDIRQRLTTDNLSQNLYTSLGGNNNRVYFCFGSWPNALKATFSEEKLLAWSKLKRKIASDGTKKYFGYTEEILINKFYKIYKIIRAKFGYFDFKLYGDNKPKNAPSHVTFRRQYGSVKAFYKKVREIYGNEMKYDLILPYDEEDFKYSLTMIYEKYGAVCQQFIKYESAKHACICATEINRRYGGIKKACKYFNIPYTDKVHHSKLSIAVEKMANEILNCNGILEKTWSWLKYKKHLFVDIYYKKHNLAIEVQGDQHYKKCKMFHRTDADFELGLKRDKIKKNLLIKHNINVVYINKKNIKNIQQILEPYLKSY